MARATTTDTDRRREDLRRRRDRLLNNRGPLTVTQRAQLAAINAQITALGD